MLQQKLYSEIARIQFLAEQDVSKSEKGSKETAKVLSTAVQNYEDLLATQRGTFDMELLTSMIQGISLIAVGHLVRHTTVG